tara:strand:- start:108 stop:1124 length:1017 start_codon:yes stop_codon:yes gene_type:complete
MPKNHVRRARKNNPETEQERRDAKKQERAMCAQASTFLDDTWNRLKSESIKAGMSLEQFENTMCRTTFNEGILNMLQFQFTGVLPDDARAREADRMWNDVNGDPIELMARIQKAKELVEKQKAICANTDAEFKQSDGALVNVRDSGDGACVHIYYNIALLLRCPTSKILDYNLNMMENVVYMTTYEQLQIPVISDEEWHSEDGNEKPTKCVIDTHGVCFKPMTTTLFRIFTSNNASMVNLIEDNAMIYTDNKSALFFKRTGNIAESLSVTFFLWAASKESRKLLRRSCNVCAKTRDDDTFLCCNQCKRIYYCSVECQKEGWPIHKRICKEIRDDVASI